MRDSKRKKLEAKGWRISTPKEFLGLSDEEEAHVNLKLAEGPKGSTASHGHTQVDLAHAIKSSHSRGAKMEAGVPTVSLDLLLKSPLALGTSNRE